MHATRSFALFVLLTALLLPALASADEQKFGDALSEDAVKVTIDELITNPDAWVDKLVRVEGLVTDVCSKRGCWIKLAGEKDFQEIRFKVKDGVMVFPMEAKGRKAVAEGVWTKFELSKEQVIERGKHHAEEKGETFDESTVTGPEVHYQLAGKGAVIK